MDFSMLLRRAVRNHSENVAVWCDGESQSYEQLWERSCRLANGLRDLGVEPGDRVTLFGDNCLQTVEQVAGVALGNFVRSGLYTHATPESNAYLLELIDARALIVQRKHLERLAGVFGDLENSVRVIVYDGDAPNGTVAYEDLLAHASPSDPEVVVAAEDDHIIRFSAGTAGKPKGIVHTVAGWMGVGNELAVTLPRLDEDDCYLAAGPLTHAATLLLWPTLQAGGEIVVMPAFDPARALDLIEQRRVTFTQLVPTMIQILVNHPGVAERDLSSLRFIPYGASPISERTLVDAIAVWGNIMFQVYGQSECVPVTALSPLHHRPEGDEHERRWLRSAGRPTPNSTVTILDENAAPLPPGEIGEIAINSPGRMKGIWRDPEATAARLLSDGSVLSRDMGYIDEDGFLFLADRKEDMIISGGFNIWPAELENALASHPAVLEACVVGVPHPKWGETPVGVVVLREGRQADEQELIAWTAEKVGSVKKVTAVKFASELPKTPIGKILRREVRRLHWTAAESRVAGA
jgi:acyl-CoA synthetase (AMP-forming)/AMP-acid ligase II